MFNSTDFLHDHFGTPDGVLGLIAKHGGAMPQRPAVIKWFSRGSVPGDWWPVLLQVLRCENSAYPDLTPYFEATDNDIFA